MLLSWLKPLAASILRLLLSNLSWSRAFTSANPTPPRYLPAPTQSKDHNHDNNEIFLSLIPHGAWDSHMHIIDPVNYSLAADAQYTPNPHLLPSALSFKNSVNTQNIVIVQPSIYGNDNSCLLSALTTLGPSRSRGVVTFETNNITTSTLRKYHALGVRGVRINLQSVGASADPVELASTLHQYADIIRPLGWVLQLYVPLETAIVLEDIVPDLNVRVCFDHFGSPDLTLAPKGSRDPYAIPGFRSLVNLLEQGSTFVKMSAPYRLSNATGWSDLEPIGRELLRVAGMKRVVFASDWPHTRFEDLDIRPFYKIVMEWCNWDKRMIDRVFKGNAEDLWDVDCEK
ncbi:putative TIM barrel metal-dependent hydrolase [Rhexocercosporidium sp. MPI-PUGE-AT-0058]|nr:putative TIM barrel metal-dependent hydrolase [Rhexocercosporidium sp. MPI-PUGE-AT-0058]